MLSSGTCRDSPACPRECQPAKSRGASGRRRLIQRRLSMIRKSGYRFPKRSCSIRKMERDDNSKSLTLWQPRALLHATFLNRQALYLRPDPARVIVRPFKPATEPRDLNPTDKTRANHIVERVLNLDSKEAASQLADVLENFEGRHRNLLETFELRADEMEEALAAHSHFFQSPAPAHRRLFPERVFVRSLGTVQSQHRAAPRPVGDAGRQPALHSQPPRRRRRTRLVADVSRRHRRGRRQHFCRADGPARFKSPGQIFDAGTASATKSRSSSGRIRTSANASSFR